jgi:primosomal protein N' (replication factor Y)
VFFQTFQPENPAIQFAARYDWAGFYAWELEQRRSIGYPPFARLVRLECRHADAEAVRKAAEALAQRLRFWLQEDKAVATTMIGPVPCYYERMDGQFRWQIVLRGPQPAQFLRRHLPLGEHWRVEVDPVSLL